MKERYIYFDDGTHFIRSLQLADQHLRAQLKDEAVCSWIAAALHDALYSLLIEKLVRTDGFGVFNDKFEKEVEEFYASGKSSTSREFIELCDKSLKQSLAGIGMLISRANLASGAVILKADYDDLDRPSLGICRLKEFRDFLAHPRPMLAAYEEGYLIQAFEDTVVVLREVARLPGERRIRHDPNEAEVLISSIDFYIRKWQQEQAAQ